MEQVSRGTGARLGWYLRRRPNAAGTNRVSSEGRAGTARRATASGWPRPVSWRGPPAYWVEALMVAADPLFPGHARPGHKARDGPGWPDPGAGMRRQCTGPAGRTGTGA
jgi:hypothetical protein